MSCPVCHTPLPADAVIAGVAQCAACDTIYEPGVAVAERANLATSVGPPPLGVRVGRRGDMLVLTLPWRANVNAGGYLLQLAFAAAPVAAFLADEVGPWVLLITAHLTYNLLYTLTNATTVAINSAGVAVSHGPLPSYNFGATLHRSALRDVHVDAAVTGVRYQRTHYNLRASGEVLLKEWNDRAPLAYVASCISAVTGAATRE